MKENIKLTQGTTVFTPIELNVHDVPGSELPNVVIENNTVPQLKRWLELRGIPTKGNKPQLIEKFVIFTEHKSVKKQKKTRMYVI